MCRERSCFSTPTIGRALGILAGLCVLLVVTPVAAAPCEVVDNGSGTVNLPPPGCPYVSPSDFHLIVNGLPPGTQINVGAEHREFFNVISGPGGPYPGGEIEQFDSTLALNITGTGSLSGFNRFIMLPISSTTAIGARNLGDPVQTFPNEMVSLDGQLLPGDPDFCQLRITAGSGQGLPPSTGQTTLTKLPNGNFNVDSFFDIVYRIEFQGCPGSALNGFGGTTQATVRMRSGEVFQGIGPCVVPDDGSGTVVLPPPNCSYLSPNDVHMIIDGLPPGTEILLGPEHRRFSLITSTPGGNLGGHIETFQSDVAFSLDGTGDLAGFHRDIVIPLSGETHTGPRGTGSPQDFDNDMFRLQGQIIGDPDFDLLRVTAGTFHGMPSPGHTTLTQLPSSNWNVDSFFDIDYRIEFQGAPGGPLAGLSGITNATIRMQSGVPSQGCSPIPPGTDTFPSTAKLVLQLTGQPDPFVLRLSSAGQPDTIVQRGPQIGDTIQTEMLQLDLRGFHPQTGQVHVRLKPGQQTLGQISNIEQDPSTCDFASGDSFFDVFAEIELVDLGQTWSTDRPLHLQRKMKTLPPLNEPYENPFVDPVNLIDNASGSLRGQVFYELHRATPDPPPPGQDCFPTGLTLNATIPSLGLSNTPLFAQGPITVQRGPASFPLFCDFPPAPCFTAANCPIPGSACVGGLCRPPLIPCTGPASCPGGAPCLPRATIDTEMVEMQLQGSHPQIGPFQVVVRPTGPPSQGQIQSRQGGRTYYVDSFFDIFFEMNTPGPRLHNNNAVRVSNIGSSGQDGIADLPPPPGTAFRSPPGQQTQLFDQSNQPVGQISNVNHTLDPPLDWIGPPPEDEDCFDSWVTLEIDIPPCPVETVMLGGIFRVLRDAPRASTTSLGQEIIDLLMAKGVFSGSSSCLGALTVRLDPGQTSGGSTRSLAPDEFFPADSFFDIFMRADAPGLGLTDLRGGPSRMTTTVNSLPPAEGEVYFGPGTVIPIFNGPTQIGQIREVSHEVHAEVVCPADCKSQLKHENPTIGPPNKNRFSVRIPGGGGGVVYDVIRGDLALLRSTGTLSGATCLQQNGPGFFVDTQNPTNPGEGFYYVARDGFGAYNATWNSGGPAQVGNRDLSVAACPP